MSEIQEAERQALLRRLLASRQFAHADNLKRILRFLVERQVAGQDAPKEYEIAVTALGRAPSFDPRTDPIVRVSVAAIRERLFAFFATEGASERWRAEIPKGQYQLYFAPNEVVKQEEELARRPVSQLWQPYLTGPNPNYIVYTEPLFLRDNRGGYVRSWQVNEAADARERIAEFYPALTQDAWQPAYHYLSAGEMHCLLSLNRVFHEAGVPVDTRNSRHSNWGELSRANLILLGSPRTNQFLRQLQGGLSMRVEEQELVLADGSRRRGRRFEEGDLGRLTEFAIVTRRPGLGAGTTVTMIAANHGRAIEGAAHWLTLDDQVEKVINALGGKVAGSFQLLFRVECVDMDDQVSGVYLEEAHIYG